jgi:NADH:ubiquinone oxidoreductase subunit 6 (subunit J)
METYTIYDFYQFVQNVSIIFSVGFAIVLFFCSIAFLNCWDYEMNKKELIFCITIAILFIGCLSCSIFMNYLQIR